MAGKPDVRVKLTAEGVAEVVSALKKIQKEGTKTSAKTARGFGGLNSVLGSTRGLLGGMGIAIGFVTFKRMIGGAIEAADQINKLGAKVGATTEHLSALSLVARTSDADLNQVGAALIRMNKNLGDAAAGLPTALGLLSDLGVELKDFKGKDSVEIFAMISEALFDLEDQLKRDRIAIGLFGRSGAQLKPTMKALADEGLGAVIQRAEELGVLIDRDLAKASEKIKDDVEILKMQSESMSIHFIAGFGPAMSQVLQTLSGNIGSTGDAWQEFGSGIGSVMKFVVGVVSAAVDVITFMVGGMAVSISSMLKTAGLALRGDFEGAKREMETYKRWLTKEYTEISERMQSRFQLLLTPASVAGEEAGAERADADEETAYADLQNKKALALQTLKDREIALIKKAAALKTKAEKREFKEGLQGVTEYYEQRRKILTAAYDEELRALKAKEEATEFLLDPAKQEEEREKIRLQREAAELVHANAMIELTTEERDTVRDLAEERIGLEQTLLEMQGRRTEAERLGFEEQLAAVDLLYRRRGESDAAREAAVQRLRAALEAGVDFEDAKNEAETALADLGTKRDAIEARAAEGLLGQAEAEAELLEIERARLGTLAELAAALLTAAEATGDPEKIEQARAFSASIMDIAHSVESATLSWDQFKATALDATQSALADFFTDGAKGAETLEEAFRNMAASIIGDLKRLVAELLAAAIMRRVSGFFSGGGGVGDDFIGPMPAAARGGQFRGPGTGTSDSILAAVSHGEFINTAAVVSQPGVLRHLRDLNLRGARALTPDIVSFRTPGFAEGGLVDAAAGEGAGIDGKLVLGLEDGLVLREIKTTAGQRVLIETITDNRRAVRAALGL